MDKLIKKLILLMLLGTITYTFVELSSSIREKIKEGG